MAARPGEDSRMSVVTGIRNYGHAGFRMLEEGAGLMSMGEASPIIRGCGDTELRNYGITLCAWIPGSAGAAGPFPSETGSAP